MAPVPLQESWGIALPGFAFRKKTEPSNQLTGEASLGGQGSKRDETEQTKKAQLRRFKDQCQTV